MDIYHRIMCINCVCTKVLCHFSSESFSEYILGMMKHEENHFSKTVMAACKRYIAHLEASNVHFRGNFSLFLASSHLCVQECDVSFYGCTHKCVYLLTVALCCSRKLFTFRSVSHSWTVSEIALYCCHRICHKHIWVEWVLTSKTFFGCKFVFKYITLRKWTFVNRDIHRFTY